MFLREKRYLIAFVSALCLLVGSTLLVAAGRPKQTGQADAVRDLRGVDRGDVPMMVVPAGPHHLTTPLGSSRVPIVVPANFFFEGSDAVNVYVDMLGVPLGAKPKRADGFRWGFGPLNNPNRWDEPYDTCMVQYQNAVLPTIGSQATVDLKLDVVRMRSADTISVTGSNGSREYEVSFELRPYHQEEGRTEKMGSMSFTRTGRATGKFTADFYAWARYTFTPLDGSAPVVNDIDEQLHISVHEATPTRFFVPALDNGTDIAEEVEVAAPVPSELEPCIGGCCCCRNTGPGGCHCPST